MPSAPRPAASRGSSRGGKPPGAAADKQAQGDHAAKPVKNPPAAATAKPTSKSSGGASAPARISSTPPKATVTQNAKPASKTTIAKPAKTTAKPAEIETPAAAPRKAMSNAAAAQALMASAAAGKEAAREATARAAAKAAEPPPPPVQHITPPVASRPGMSRPGMPGMRPAFSITPRMPMGALRSGGMAETQAGAPGAPKTPPAKVDFRAGDMVVYPTHGVGTVQGLEDVNVAGISLQVITVTFEENRMTLRVPTNKAASAGLRKLAGTALVKQALDTLKGRARIKRTMWSRRAQEYEAKINSGDPVAIAEVVRDLFRNAGQPDQSFSERQIYEQALDRLAMEFAAIEKTDKPTAIERLIAHMRSAEKPGGKVAEDPIEED